MPVVRWEAGGSVRCLFGSPTALSPPQSSVRRTESGAASEDHHAPTDPSSSMRPLRTRTAAHTATARTSAKTGCLPGSRSPQYPSKSAHPKSGAQTQPHRLPPIEKNPHVALIMVAPTKTRQQVARHRMNTHSRKGIAHDSRILTRNENTGHRAPTRRVADGTQSTHRTESPQPESNSSTSGQQAPRGRAPMRISVPWINLRAAR